MKKKAKKTKPDALERRIEQVCPQRLCDAPSQHHQSEWIKALDTVGERLKRLKSEVENK